MSAVLQPQGPAGAAPHTLAKLAALRERIVGVEQRVPLADGSMRPYANLDNAASTPALREVRDAVEESLQWYASVHRGAGYKSRIATQAYERSREVVTRFVGANECEHVTIFGKNTTEAINKLSYRLALTRDDVVLVSMLEHHSNDLPWRARAQVVHIGADSRGRLDENHYVQLLARHAGRVKLVAVTGASNVTGEMPDIYRIAESAHQAGAQVLVDCAQRAAHRPIAMGTLADPAHLDYVALSGHKMYAPFGVGALVARRDTFERGEPEYRGGGTIRFVSLDAVSWGDAPDRDEAGSPNVIGAVALAAAIDALGGIGMAAVAQHEAELTAYALRGLAGIDGLRIYGDTDARDASRRLAVIPFNVEGVPHALVAAVLAEEHGIGVRNGCFCAHPYVAHLLGLSNSALHKVRLQIANDDLSALPGMARASFGMYTSVDEIDRLLAALRAIACGEIAGRYVLDARRGEYTLRDKARGPACIRPPFSLNEGANELGSGGTRTG